MLIKRKPDLSYSDVTPKGLYMGRRNFLLGLLATTGVVAGWKKFPGLFSGPGTGSVPAPLNVDGGVKWSYSTKEKVTPQNEVTHYNNYYEFGTGKEDPAQYSKNFVTSPWTVQVDGEVEKPRKFTMDEILKLAPLEERIYRHRCVEAWSIVVPWIGYPFSTLANLVVPTAKAKYVAFQTYFDPKQMPLGGQAGIQLPYVVGLRLDEAMNLLELLSMGMYGDTFPNQDGALVRIRFVKDMPPTTWNIANSHEYGFYSNVNPNVDHPRWSQAKERRLGEFLKRPTLMFNGYDQVASLYSGMDLRKNF